MFWLGLALAVAALLGLVGWAVIWVLALSD
jgi:hypothetical protein